jgi:hypothetical protein
MKFVVVSILLVLIFMSCNSKQKAISPDHNEPEGKSQLISMTGNGWTDLFDGKTTKGWRTYKKDAPGKSWIVENGNLILKVVSDRKGRTKSEDGGDLITQGQYENFELEVEWQISKCGNSGILFNVVESADYDRVYHTGPEMQILDNACHPDARIHTHRAGDLYDLIACTDEVVKPAGEWNLSVIRIVNGQAEFYLNTVKVVEFTMFGKEWSDMIAGSKFKNMPGFGKSRRGHIALQDHGDGVAFRHIRIREM